jgi:multiple sugar transport system permease protein
MARRSGLKAQERRTGFLLLLPALVAFAAVILVPFLQSLRLSLYKYTIEMESPTFAGLANFHKLLADPGMATVWLNTLVFVVLTTGLTFILGLGWALMMNQSFAGRGFVRAVSLLPWVLPTTVTAFLAAWIFNGQYGVLNAVLLQSGVIREPITWLAEEKGAMAAVILTKAWLSVPLFMAFFLAGLQGVSQDQIDAARVDGCENLGVLAYVVLPHMAPEDSAYFIASHVALVGVSGAAATATAAAPVLFWRWRKAMPGGALPWIAAVAAVIAAVVRVLSGLS